MFNFIYQIPGLDKQTSLVLIAALVMLVFAVLVQIFTCLAINSDAKAKGIKKRVLFAVLGFFFPLLITIVYLILRNNLAKIQPKICNNCGLTVDNSANMCPQCGCCDFTDYLIVDNEKNKKKAKGFAITALVMYVIVLALSIGIQYSGALSTSNFARDKNDYSYDNDYQYGDDYGDDEDDYDDYDDFFNQFGYGENDFSQDEPSIQQ